MNRILRPAPAPLSGRVAVPGDKSISHRVAMLAPLATPERAAAAPASQRGRPGGLASRARGWLDAGDTRRTLDAVRALGAEARLEDGTLTIEPGRFPPACGGAGGAAPGDAPPLLLDCGNSGTTARLLLGLLAGRRADAVIDGDESLRARPFARVVEPLRALGADISWLSEPDRLPVRVRGRPLRGGACALPVASAQVKSALLLAGLTASAPLRLTGGGSTRDHTERLLRLMGARLRAQRAGEGDEEEGEALVISPGGPLAPFDVEVPGDFSSAAFIIAAALLVPGSAVTVEGVSLNPGRTGLLRALERMGARIEVSEDQRRGGWEPRGEVAVRHAPLRAIGIAAPEAAGLIDELPLLALLAARAEGVSEIRGAAELRVKESDRIAASVALLRAFGAAVTELPDGWRIAGPQALRAPAAAAPTAGDHRLAMTAAVAALAAAPGGQTALDDDACVAISFPGFFELLQRLQAGGSAA